MLRSFTLYLLLFPLGLPRLTLAQTSLQQQAPSRADSVDARAFALLFRRENAYLEQAKKAESQEKPAAQLPFIMTRRLGLREEQRFDFEQLAQAWEADIAPVRTEMNSEITRFHATFPGGRLNDGVVATPPDNIRDLRRKLDGITLQYRDRLRNSLPESDYQLLHNEALRATGANLASYDTLSSGGNQ